MAIPLKVAPDKTPRNQTSRFIAKYSRPVAAQFRSARAYVRKLFPRGYELVYDNYNALGCGFSTTPRSSNVVVSVVAYPKWVTLFFFNGKRLPDPDKILQGSGVRIRSLRLQPASLLQSKAVHALLSHVIGPYAADLAAAPKLTTIVKSVAARQRPRRPPEKAAKNFKARGSPPDSR